MDKNTWEVTKLKAVQTTNIAKKVISLYDRVENTAGKGENACYQHFLLFPQCFPQLSSIGWFKAEILWLPNNPDFVKP